ncbi:DUF6768 family protein [Ekhidna sp.]|uniref:DUF6768 family protein n=1 Tax=Ekhidna sp. TaxID=2608089 RepID=UPI003B5091A8
MKTNEDIDQMIKEALSEDEKELFNTYDEQSLLQKFGGLFHGKMKWLNAMTFIVQLIMFGFAIYFGYRFFGTTDNTELFRFGAGFFLTTLSVTMLKMYHWMEMNKNTTIREIKRLELQVSVLAKSFHKN